MNYFLISYFVIGLLLATVHGTWLIAFGAGGFSLLAYYLAKIAFPGSNAYQYVLSAVFGVFMAQFIYQMHGLFEMYFLAFIGSTILITYQKWQLQIPILIVVFVHQAIFSYMQNIGFSGGNFIRLNYFDLQTFIIHIALTVVIFFICGLWAYQLNKYSEMLVTQTLKMAKFQKEAQLSIDQKQNAEALGKLNMALQEQANELARSNSELEQFAYAASHDLQEPLRTITGFLARLETKYSEILDDKGKQYIHFAVDGAQRMRQIILDLLEFSQVGKSEDKLEEVDIHKVVAEITGLYRKLIEEEQATIVFENLPTLQTFKAPVRQIFQNLIGNSLKYQKPGAKPFITVLGEEEENQWHFSVKDNGIGISASDFNKIFIIFKRLHGKETYSGNGLGLAVTKKIIENLGGKIWVESEEGKGSTFHFTILKTS